MGGVGVCVCVGCVGGGGGVGGLCFHLVEIYIKRVKEFHQ